MAKSNRVNKAVGEFESEHLRFDSWYSSEIIKYLVHFDPADSFLKYVFYDGNAGDNTFCNQLDSLNTIKNALSIKQSFSFISKEPGVGQNHFIFGIFVQNKLLIINPVGVSSHKDLYGELANWQQQGRGLDIYLSNTKIQNDPDKYVSCGPICVELMRCISKQPKEKLLGLFKGVSDDIKEKEGLTYYDLDIESIIPKSLKALLDTGDKYQDQMMTIRKSHLELLKDSPSLKDLPVSAQEKYLIDHCENNTIQEVIRKFTLGGSGTDAMAAAKEIQEYIESLDKLGLESNIANPGGASLSLPKKDANISASVKEIETNEKELEQKKLAAIDKIKVAYKIAKEHYEKGELGLAEQSFVKAIQPVLSKVSLEMHNFDAQLEDCKELLLDSMHYLGQIYLQSNKYPNYHAKAAAIFQYCFGFAKKYKLGSGEQYLKKAYEVERDFLKITTGIRFQDKNLTSYQERYAKYKKDLVSYRESVKEELDEINQIGVDQIAERAKRVENLYGRSTKFFVNNGEDKSESPGLIQKFLQECYKQLGPAPKGCEFTIVGLGSIAGGKMTPYSDIELAILVNKNIPEYKEYLRNLTKLLNIKIVNLGESMMRQMGIEALSNFKTGKSEDDWFWDEVIDGGIRFDSMNPLGCKSPLGRQGYQGYRDYELILTPEEMAAFQKEVERKEGEGIVNEKSWFETDEHLVQGLRSTMLIDGSKELLQEYREKLPEAVSEDVIKERLLEILRKDIDKFKLKLGDQEEGKLFNVKMEIYRLGDRIMEALADYYGIREQKKDSNLTVWQKIEKLEEKGNLSSEGAGHLKEAVSIATELRMQTYCHNKSQQEGITTYKPYIKHLSAKKQQELLEKTFHIKDTKILHHFYYVMLPLQMLIGEKLLYSEIGNYSRLDLSSSGMFNNQSFIKGLVNIRLLECKQAMENFEDYLKGNAHSTNFTDLEVNLYVIHRLLILYRDLGEVTKGMELAYVLEEQITSEEFLSVAIKYKMNIDVLLSDIGEIYRVAGRYSEALKYYQNAEFILEENTKSSKSDIFLGKATLYNRIGIVYSKMGNFFESEKYFIKSLNFRKEFIANNPDHKETILPYLNLSNLYLDFNKTDLVSLYLKKAQKLSSKRINGSYPNYIDMVPYLNVSGIGNFKKQEYEKASKNFLDGLQAIEYIYKDHSNHKLKLYNNIAALKTETEDYFGAFEYYYKILRLVEDARCQVDQNDYLKILKNIAIWYIKTRENDNLSELLKQFMQNKNIVEKFSIPKISIVNDDQVIDTTHIQLVIENVFRDWFRSFTNVMYNEFYSEQLDLLHDESYVLTNPVNNEYLASLLSVLSADSELELLTIYPGFGVSNNTYKTMEKEFPALPDLEEKQDLKAEMDRIALDFQHEDDLNLDYSDKSPHQDLLQIYSSESMLKNTYWEMYHDALEICQEVLVVNNPSTSQSLNIGYTCGELSNYKEAANNLREISEVFNLYQQTDKDMKQKEQHIEEVEEIEYEEKIEYLSIDFPDYCFDSTLAFDGIKDLCISNEVELSMDNFLDVERMSIEACC